MSLFVERTRLEQETGEPLQAVRITPAPDKAEARNSAGVLVVAGEAGITSGVEERLLSPLAEFGFFVAGIQANRDPDIAIDDVAAGLLYLRELAGGRLGVIGFDAAGAVVLEAATMLPQIDAVIHAGGSGPRKGARLSRTRSSVQVHRALRSSALTDEVCAHLKERIWIARKALHVYKYDADDGFVVRPRDDEERHHAQVASDRMRDFLQQQLVL